MFSDWFSTRIEKSANGTVSGSASRIVIGWIQLSNCAARIRYMKMIDSRNANMKFVKARPCSRERPVKPVAYSGGMFSAFVSCTSLSMTVCAE